MFGFGRSTTRAPPPTGQPPPYSIARYYRQSLRPVVIATGIIAAIWGLLWGINSFQNISPDNSHNFGGIVPFDIVIGALYMGVAAIEILGIFAAFKQSVPLMRIYSLASLLALALVIGAEIIQLIVHFHFKGTLIGECTRLTTGDLVYDDDFGSFGSHNVHNLTANEAQNYCNSAFNHDTFTDIVWLIVSILIGLFFASVAFAYYRQLLDPSSIVSRTQRRQGNNVPLQTFGGPYGGQTYGYNPYQQPQDYAPPYDNSKLPEYGYTGGPVESKGIDEKENVPSGSH